MPNTEAPVPVGEFIVVTGPPPEAPNAPGSEQPKEEPQETPEPAQ